MTKLRLDFSKQNVTDKCKLWVIVAPKTKSRLAGLFLLIEYLN